MPHLRLSLLGPFQATLDESPLTGFRADTARALLAYLAVNVGTPFRREALAGLLWPDQPESVARQNLRQMLYRLRTAIGDQQPDPPFLLITLKTVQFNPASDYWLDVAAFTALLDACRPHSHRLLDACPFCVARLGEAVELYRGDLLAGFTLPDSDLFEQWRVVKQEELHRRALDALTHLAAYHERRREYEQASRYLRRQVELEPWREEAHRGLMRALALSGQRSAALAQYESCRQLSAFTAADAADFFGGRRSRSGWSRPCSDNRWWWSSARRAAASRRWSMPDWCRPSPPSPASRPPLPPICVNLRFAR